MSKKNYKHKLPFVGIIPKSNDMTNDSLSEAELAFVHKEQLLMSIIDADIITDAKAILKYPTKQQWLIDMTILKRLDPDKNEVDLKK